MSTYADPAKGVAYLDVDFFRAPAGTPLPTNPLALPPVSGTAPGVTWDAFGGLQMGFDLTPSQDITKHRVMNYRKSAYAVTAAPRDDTFKFKATDRSKATFLTMLEGGEVVELDDDLFEYVKGDGEEFAGLAVARDITANAFFYCSRLRLGTPPPRTFKGDDLDGWEFELIALDKIREGGDANPLA